MDEINGLLDEASLLECEEDGEMVELLEGEDEEEEDGENEDEDDNVELTQPPSVESSIS